MRQDTVTPSMARGVRLTPRLPDFEFDRAAVPDQWFSNDPGITAAWNALSVIATVAERNFIETGRWLLDRIDDPVVADECARFVQQESYHSAVHARFNRVLAERGLPVRALDRFVDDVLRELRDEGGHQAFLGAVLAGEQAIGELGFSVLARPESMDGASPAARALFMWHWFEEVEHSAALHDAWTFVHGTSEAARRTRVLGALYLALVITATWGAGAWVMLDGPARSARFRRSTWRGVARQLAGRDGLLRDALSILWGLRRRDFHPFDRHEPGPLLDAHRGAVEPAWERPLKRAPSAERKPTVEPLRAPGVRDALAFARYAGWLVARTARFVREPSEG